MEFRQSNFNYFKLYRIVMSILRAILYRVIYVELVINIGIIMLNEK